MSERVSTAGMYIAYVVGDDGATPPKEGYTIVPEIKSMPSFNPTPNTIQSTTLLETEYHTYVEGLKDLGGALEYSANLTDDLIDFVEGMVTAYEGMATGKAMWFAVVHPKLTRALFFQGKPSRISFNEASVDAMAETTVFVTPNTAPVWGDKPTIATGASNFSVRSNKNSVEV